MKKITVFFIMLFFINNFIFGLEESYINIGFGYKHISTLTGDTDPLGNQKSMINLNIRGYGFWENTPIGMYVYGMTARPVYASSGNHGQGLYSGMLQEWIVGISLKHIMNDRLILLSGMGLGLNIDTIKVNLNTGELHNADIYNLGIGGDIGLKLNFNRTMHLMLGLNLLYSFVNYTDITYSNIKNKDTKWETNSVISPNIFLGFGFNRYFK